MDDPLRLDRQICFPLYAATNLLTRLYRPVLAEIGLTYSQYLVMLVLWEQAPQSVSALRTPSAAACGSAMSRTNAARSASAWNSFFMPLPSSG